LTRTYRTVNPATGELVREFAPLSDEDAERLLVQSHGAYGSWRLTKPTERAKLLATFADLVESNAEELAALVTTEMGKPLAEARDETHTAAEMFRYYAAHGEELLADEHVDVPGFARSLIRRESLGVVVGIEPWNGPLYMAMRVAAPNLMLGNTVLLKPAEICASSTMFFDHLFVEAGFPPYVFQTALVSVPQISAYISDRRVRAVTLTGSDRAGSSIGEQAGRNVKPVVLELGGSDAFIVLDSADVQKAADVASTRRLNWGGQICVSPKRVIVTDAVADEFIARYVETFTRQIVGDPFAPETTVGPLSSIEAADQLQAQLQDALDKGATLLASGGRVDGPGAYFRPAVLTDISADMRIFSEEAFGPLGMVYRVSDAQAAVDLANASQYGLSATVFGDEDDAREVAALLDTGGVGINGFLGAPIEIPFGGTKRSGLGRELGRSGMDQYANIKTYAIE
jgi:succinate-semialdehyde dehydrogenase/glutarate-semialdehyde dehydrogenase